jgi:hypothetical protein
MKFTETGYIDNSIDTFSLLINIVALKHEKPEDLPWDYILELFLTLKDPPTA